MKLYEIKNFGDKCFIFSTSFHNPTEKIIDIEKKLNKLKFKGTVIFDLLLSNGNTRQRFFKTEFDNKFVKDVFEKVDNADDEIKKRSIEFYSKNINLVNESQILSNPIKFLIKQGRLI